MSQRAPSGAPSLKASATAGSSGRPLRRLDAPLKVTGTAKYTADYQPDDMAHAVLVCSPIASGRIITINAADTECMPGVLGIVSHENASKLLRSPAPQWPSAPEELLRRSDHGAGLTFADRVIRYAGQPVAAVIADTLANATAAAQTLTVEFAETLAITDLRATEGRANPPRSGEIPGGEAATSARGNADAALASSAVTVLGTYLSPAAHHNPIEAAATIAEWNAGRVRISSRQLWQVHSTWTRAMFASCQRSSVEPSVANCSFGRMAISLRLPRD